MLRNIRTRCCVVGLVACSSLGLACSGTGPSQSGLGPTTTAVPLTPVASNVQTDPAESTNVEAVGPIGVESADTGGPDLDDPTKDFGEKKVHLKSVAEATALLRSEKGHENVTAIEGKYIDVKIDDIIQMNGGVLLHYKKDRAYVSQDFTGNFSNGMAVDFIAFYGAGSAPLGTRLELIDLGNGFSGVFSVGRATSAMRFGTDDRLVEVVAPPTKQGEALVLKLSKALARELSEVSKPGTKRPPLPPTPTVPLPTTLEPLPIDSADPNPAKGIDPPEK